MIMENLLLSVAIGDISGSIYEYSTRRTKNYDDVVIFHEYAEYTDDTVCTFACAESLIFGKDIKDNLQLRCKQHIGARYGGRFYDWIFEENPQPYNSFGNGSAMRCSAAGWLASSEEECVQLATATAKPTHNHPEGIKGAVATALTIFYLYNGKNKEFIKENVLAKFYPEWRDKRYVDFHDTYKFDASCQGTVPPAIICFLESKDYVDSLKLAIALGGDADTLAAIVGPMSYAYFKEIPQPLIDKAKEILPQWMIDVNESFDNTVRLLPLLSK